MTRLLTLALSLSLAFLVSACGGGSTPPAQTGDTTKTPTEKPAETAAVPDEHGEDDDPHDEGHTHKEGTIADETATVELTGDQPSFSATTNDGWAVQITSTPSPIALGDVTWDVVVRGPGDAEVTPGQLLIEPEAQESNTGKRLPLTLIPGDPGHAQVTFTVEEAGTYEVEFHLHRSDGGDSHTKYVFTVA